MCQGILMLKVSLKKQLKSPQGTLDLDISFDVKEGEFVTLFGKSGSGKTTVLRMIAGLTRPDEGAIEVGGQVWFDRQKKINLAVQKRALGFVFQDYNLFPHMSVQENLEFALVNKNDQKLVDELLSLAHLTSLKNRNAQTLSAGEKQRVAIVRALLRRPKILLLDEPLAALDEELRFKLQDDILALTKRLAVTTICVSHDLSEVFKLSDRILWLEAGRITKSGPPVQLLTDQSISGKFKFIGEILEIKKSDVVNILTIQIGRNLTKVVATDEEIKDLRVGEKVIVSAKAFNPIILSTRGK